MLWTLDCCWTCPLFNHWYKYQEQIFVGYLVLFNIDPAIRNYKCLLGWCLCHHSGLDSRYSQACSNRGEHFFSTSQGCWTSAFIYDNYSYIKINHKLQKMEFTSDTLSERLSTSSPHQQYPWTATESLNGTYSNESLGVTLTGIATKESLVPVDTLWYTIHAVAIVSLTVSIISSVIVIVWQQKASSAKEFFKRKLGERLVVYLAVTDLFYSISHFLDHLVNILGHGVPSHTPCVIFASVTMECIFAQSAIVLFTAISLCLLVSCNRKIKYGPYDVILLLVSYGPPLILVVFSLVKGYIGNNGYW